jgi:DNA polymerase II small subunit/DNA polymerase delta subunit B
MGKFQIHIETESQKELKDELLDAVKEVGLVDDLKQKVEFRNKKAKEKFIKGKIEVEKSILQEITYTSISEGECWHLKSFIENGIDTLEDILEESMEKKDAKRSL